MPRISYFYGIVVTMYHDEHNPPHFHVLYSGAQASFALEPLRRVRGRWPGRAERLVLEWAALHRDELVMNWERAQRGEELITIDPLD